MSLRGDMLTILRAEAGLTALVPASRMWDRPLLRPNEDPEGLGTEATPEAFESTPPFWLKTNIVVGSRMTRVADYGRVRQDSQTARWGVTLAYYVPPDGDDLFEQISWQVSVAFGRAGALVSLPNGRKGRVVVPHDISPSVPVPEFPGCGFVMLERLEIPTTWVLR